MTEAATEPAPRALPKASVIIVNTNELHHLRRCLPSLFRQRYADCEVLVVDNNSSDGSVEYITSSYPQVKLIKNSGNLGYAGANNVGFRHATGEYLAVLNPDTEVDPDWLAELVLALEANPTAGLATSKLLLMDRPERIQACGTEISFTGLTTCRGLEQSRDKYNGPETVSAVSGAAFVIKRRVLEHIGGFDEEFFMYYEDTELSLRAMLASYTCLYVPTSVVYHQYAFRFNPQKCFVLERNRWFGLIKTLRWRSLLVLLPALVLSEVIVWGYVVLKGAPYVASKLRSYWWLLANWRRILAARRGVQALRRVDDRVILRHFSHRITLAQTTSRPVALVLEVLLGAILLVLGRTSRLVVTW